MTQELDVLGGEFECLNLAQLVLRQSGNDLAQPEEGVVQHLCSLPLAHVGLTATVVLTATAAPAPAAVAAVR